MALVVPENYAAVVQQFRLVGDAELMAITYGVNIDPATSRTANQFAADLQAQLESNLLSQFSDQYTTVGTEISWQFATPPTPPIVGFAAGTGVGARSSSVAPQNTAILVHKRSAVGGRSGRGRMYFPGVIESVVDAKGTLTGGEISGWNTALAAWLADVMAITDVNSMEIFHDSAGAYAADPPVAVSSLTCDPTVATQRRRLRP